MCGKHQRNKTGKTMKRSLKGKDIAAAVFAEYSAEKEEKSTANSLCDCDHVQYKEVVK